MPIIERDVVLTGQDENGNTTMDFPVTRLDLVEGDQTEVSETLEGANKIYLPVLVDGKMMKVPLAMLQKSVNGAQSGASETAAGLLSAEDKKKLDGLAAGATKNEPSNTTPKALGTASAGTESGFARGDHVHPMPSVKDLKIKIYEAGPTAPTDTGILWIDTTETTGGLKYHDGTAWVPVPVSTT